MEDADVWWVAAAGRRMLATGEVPRHNDFSFVEPDHPWVMHEWLFGPPYAWGLSALGPRFFALAGAGAFAVTSTLVLAATIARARHLAVGCAAALVPLVLYAHPTARPAWVALAFPAAMTVLAFRASLGRAAACACVGLELVWANAHGSFPLGVALLGAAAWACPVGRRRRIEVTVAAAAATLLNPYGMRLHALVLGYVLSSPRGPVGDLTPIVEYAPLWDARYFSVDSVAATGALGALVLVGLVGASILGRGAHRARGALVLALLPLAVLHARFAPTLAVVAAMVLTPVLDDATDRTSLAAYAGGPWRPRRGALGLSAAGIVALVAVAFGTVASRPPDAWVAGALGGPSFLRLAAQLPDGADALTPFRSAGLLLWQTSARGVRVFYDSRNDPYSPEMQHVGLTLLERPRDAIVGELERRGTTYALVPSPPDVDVNHRRGYDGALAAAPGWSAQARDGGWCLYARETR